MNQKKCFDAARALYGSSKGVYESAVASQHELLDLVEEVLRSEAFKDNFNGRKYEEFNAFEKQVFKLAEGVVQSVKKDSLETYQAKVIESYKSLLESIAEERPS